MGVDFGSLLSIICLHAKMDKEKGTIQNKDEPPRTRHNGITLREAHASHPHQTFQQQCAPSQFCGKRGKLR